MYHVELRQFPHSVNSFNLDEEEMLVIVGPWAEERVIELGERRWNPHEATLTIFEGPEIPVGALSMGRGQRIIQSEGKNVTEQVFVRVRAMIADAAAANSATAPAAGAGDSLAVGVALGALLGADPGRLLDAWREIASGAPALSPSEALALAERELAAAAPVADAPSDR